MQRFELRYKFAINIFVVTCAVSWTCVYVLSSQPHKYDVEYDFIISSAII